MRTVHKIAAAALASLVVVAGLAAPAAADVVRGRDLLTPAELQAHRTELQAAQTPEERQAIQLKMRQVLESRAAEKGDILASDLVQAPPAGRPMAPRGPWFGQRPHPGWGPCWVR
jgi:hypothetical protein